jgi:hypothetical protein
VSDISQKDNDKIYANTIVRSILHIQYRDNELTCVSTQVPLQGKIQEMIKVSKGDGSLDGYLTGCRRKKPEAPPSTVPL